MKFNEGSNQGLLFESNSGPGNDPRECAWPERGMSFAVWSYLSRENPAMAKNSAYPQRGELSNSVVDFIAREYVIATRRVNFEKVGICLTEEEMLVYWALMRNLTSEQKNSVEFAKIRIWTPENQRVFVYGDYFKWCPELVN